MTINAQVVTMHVLVRAFARIGCLSFGGPAAQIALMQRDLVHERGWIDEKTFLRGLSFCMLLPGPEAMQLATYIGWSLRGTLGGLLAGLLFVLPGAAVIACLAALYVLYGTQAQVQAAFIGVKAAVLAIVCAAMLKLARRALTDRTDWMVAALAFGALFLFDIPFPLLIAAAGLFGASRVAQHGPAPVIATRRPARRDTIRTCAVWGTLWAGPLIILGVLGHQMLFDLAFFFGKLAITTFGGAYAVLAYMTQTVVDTQGWLSPDEMIDALGLAETTPGPLILVTQFVGHLAGFAADGWGLWAIGGLVTLWMTFVPCFLWIFLGAPYLDAIMARPRLASALAMISAAVVGVMASLALWFGIHVLFVEVTELRHGPLRLTLPHPGSLSLPALVAFGLGAALLWWRDWPVPAALVSCAGCALVGHWTLP